MQKRIVAEGLEQFEHDAVQSSSTDRVTRLAIVVLVEKSRAPSDTLEKLARLRDAFDRDPDMVEFADRLIGHGRTLLR